MNATETEEPEAKEIAVELVEEPLTEQEQMKALLMLLDQLLTMGIKFKPSLEFSYSSEKERQIIEQAFREFKAQVEERKAQP